MNEKKSVLQAFGGVRRIAAMVAALALVLGYNFWQQRSSGDALAAVAGELGLQASKVGRHTRLNGRIGGVGVMVGTTSERSAGSSYNYTEFRIYAPDGPAGLIVASTLRERTLGGVSEDERVRSGDAAFDEAVIVADMPEAVLAGLDAEGRAAIIAATEAGWRLESFTWEARESGRMADSASIRELLELGLAAERVLR